MSDWPTEGLIVGGGTGASATAGSGVYGECGAMSETVMNHGPSPAFVFRKSSAWPVTYVSSQPSGFTTPSFVRNDQAVVVLARRDRIPVGARRLAGVVPPVQVLAEERRLVPGILQVALDRALHVGVKRDPARQVVDHPGVVGVAAGHDRHPRRTAQRIRDREVGVGAAAVPQPAPGVRHGLLADRAAGLVVGDDQDDVRAARAASQRRARPARRSEQDDDEHHAEFRGREWLS